MIAENLGVVAEADEFLQFGPAFFGAVGVGTSWKLAGATISPLSCCFSSKPDKRPCSPGRTCQGVGRLDFQRARPYNFRRWSA